METAINKMLDFDWLETFFAYNFVHMKHRDSSLKHRIANEA